MNGKGRRQQAARRAGRKMAQQTRQTAARKRTPGRRQLFRDLKKEAQQAQTSRAQAAARAQRRPDNTTPLPQDNIPVTMVGLSDAVEAEQTMDWTGGNGRGGGGGGNGMAAMNGNNGGWFASLSPLHKALLLGGGGYALFYFVGRKKRRK